MEYQDQQENLELLVVVGSRPNLLGRDWLMKIHINWQSLHHLQPAPPTNLQKVLNDKDKLGLVKEASAKIQVDLNPQPQFCQPRTVLYTLRVKVEQELCRLEAVRAIEPVQFADWATCPNCPNTEA